MPEEKPVSNEIPSVNPKKGREYVPDTLAASKGNSDTITRAYLDSLLLLYRHIGSTAPDTRTSLFGQECGTPIMSSALALLERLREGGSAEFARGMARANAVMWTGWIDNEAFRRVCDTGVKAVCGIKPFRDLDKIHTAIEAAAEAGAVAICMDVDHCFDDTGNDCGFVFGQLSGKTEEELKGFIAAANAKGIPFLLKGILDPVDAVKAKELGAGGIVASHHKGIWCYSVPPAMMLPELREAVGPDYPIYADCGVHSGVDVFKYLACGANGVGVARDLMAAFGKAGADGVYDRLMFLNDELRGTMAKCGRATVQDIDRSAFRFRTGW